MKIQLISPKFFNAIERNLKLHCPQRLKKTQKHCLPLYLENAFNQSGSYNKQQKALLRCSRLICTTFQSGELVSMLEKTTIPLFERIFCILKTQDFSSINKIKEEDLIQYIGLNPMIALPALLKLSNDNIPILNKIEPKKLGHFVHQHLQLIPEILKSHSTYTLKAIQRETWHNYFKELPLENRVQVSECALVKYCTKVNYLVKSVLSSITQQEAISSSEATATKRMRLK